MMVVIRPGPPKEQVPHAIDLVHSNHDSLATKRALKLGLLYRDHSVSFFYKAWFG